MRELCWFAKGSQVVAWDLRRMWGHRKGFLKQGVLECVCVLMGVTGREKAGWGQAGSGAVQGSEWGVGHQQGGCSVQGAVGAAPFEANFLSGVGGRWERWQRRGEHGQWAGGASPKRPLGPFQLFHPLLLPPPQGFRRPTVVAIQRSPALPAECPLSVLCRSVTSRSRSRHWFSSLFSCRLLMCSHLRGKARSSAVDRRRLLLRTLSTRGRHASFRVL